MRPLRVGPFSFFDRTQAEQEGPQGVVRGARSSRPRAVEHGGAGPFGPECECCVLGALRATVRLGGTGLPMVHIYICRVPQRGEIPIDR